MNRIWRKALSAEAGAADLKCLHEKRRVRIFEEMEKALRDELWDGTQWVADYRRIRVIASK